MNSIDWQNCMLESMDEDIIDEGMAKEEDGASTGKNVAGGLGEVLGEIMAPMMELAGEIMAATVSLAASVTVRTAMEHFLLK